MNEKQRHEDRSTAVKEIQVEKLDKVTGGWWDGGWGGGYDSGWGGGGYDSWGGGSYDAYAPGGGFGGSWCW